MRRPSLALVAFSLMGSAADATAAYTVAGNATVQPAGPRTGNNGNVFFNIEGSTNGTFASFGVVDFIGTPQAGTATALTLVLTEANAAFTRAGGLNFYLTSDTTTSISNTGGSPLTYVAASAPEGLGTQLTTRYLLGSGTFNSTGNPPTGQVDTFSFAVAGAAQTFLTSQVNAGRTVRLIVTPTDTTVAATFAGAIFNPASSRPSLTVTTAPAAAVPEPASLALLGTGVVGLVARRVRSRLAA